MPGPDLNRVMKPRTVNTESLSEDGSAHETLDLDSWRQADMDRLAACWKEACLANFNGDAVGHFRRAIHNLHGASNLYGGETLLRLTTLLQAAARSVDRLRQNTELISLLISACRISHPDDHHEAAFDQICDTLETRFLNTAEPTNKPGKP